MLTHPYSPIGFVSRAHRLLFLVLNPLNFAYSFAASSLYGWLAGTWPFGVVEGIWALVALRRWL